MGSKTKTETTQKNTYGYQSREATADENALRSQKATANPAIPYMFAQQREALNNSYVNPLGSYTSPATREAAQRSGQQGLAMAEAQAQAEGENQADNANFTRQAAIAQMTRPEFVQTGGSGTSVQSTPFNFGSLLAGGIQGGAQLGSAAMT